MTQNNKFEDLTLATIAEYAFIKITDRKTLAQLHDKMSQLAQEALLNSPLSGDTTIEIHLFELGYIGDINKKKILRWLNFYPDIFTTSWEGKVSAIGEPDIHELAYSDNRLLTFFPKSVSGVIRYGILLSPIEGNYFSRTISYDTQVLSLYQVEEICNSANRTIEEYIVQTILTDILALKYFTLTGDYMFHQDTRGCIFDFAKHKPDKVHKLKKCHIDSVCRVKLDEAPVSSGFIEAVEKSLQRIKKPTILGSIRDSLEKPFFSFIFGGLCIGVLINIATSLFLGELDSISDYYVLGILLFLIVVIIIINYVLAIRRTTLETSA